MLKHWFRTSLSLLITIILMLGIMGFDNSPAWAIDSITDLPFPKVEKPEQILGPAGEIFTFATCNRGTQGFTLADAQIPAGAGPLPHIHHHTNEWFWTPKGGLELFQSVQEYPDLSHPATDEDAGRAKVYTVDTVPNQIVYGPKNRVHGFTNITNETRPLTFIWLQDLTSPDYPFNDGGIREYFQDVGVPIPDINHLPAITDESKEEFVTHAPQYGINQSDYFLKYVSQVDSHPPLILAKGSNDSDLMAIIDTIQAFNQGDTSVSCF
ncbi:mannose-6-phosphate isomerase [Synechococcus sp. PCC 6312]|nr:mannose-6-phosphate isomerase [Synechococcus sp. PCC 6312]